MNVDYKALPDIRGEDEKLWIRPARDEDIEFMINLRNDPYIKERFVYRKDFTLMSQKNWMDNMVYTGKVIQYIVFYDDKKMGCTYYLPVEDREDEVELGIYLDPNYVGKQIGRKLTHLFCDLARDLGFNAVIARVIETNPASYRMLMAAGFNEESTFTQISEPSGKELNMKMMRFPLR
ncbi:MAG: GNAT family N-acetyltransferase [Lachnospiraceae bacterium]|nr:GNAT family N-acetyltransferase [Lachnospiraceae bacterium]